MNEKEFKNLSCWVVSEGMAGTENQCIAVAQALGIDFDIKRIALNQPWRSLSPFLKFETALTFRKYCRPQPPWPDIVIASGRKSIAAARYIKRKSGGRCFIVQIQDPRIDPKCFDLVAVPQHDPTRANNVIETHAAPNRITQNVLKEAKEEFPDLSRLKSPRVAVLIGGSSKAYSMTPEVLKGLTKQLLELDAGLMVTTSRRTGKANDEYLKNALLGPRECSLNDLKGDDQWKGTNIFMHNGHRPNPYMAMLAYADYILVTADSASMISDACSTGKPTYMIKLDGGHPRIDKLHQHLHDLGVLRTFEGKLSDYSYEPLDDAGMIADAIKERFFNE